MSSQRHIDATPVAYRVVRQPTTPSRVLVVGLDGGSTSMRGLAYAVRLARRQGWSLALVHVVSHCPTQWADQFTSGLLATPSVPAEDDELWGRVFDEVPLAGLAVELVAPVGDAVQELAKVAQERAAEAVVVGARKRRRFRFGGSVGARIAGLQLCPVLIVP